MEMVDRRKFVKGFLGLSALLIKAEACETATFGLFMLGGGFSGRVFYISAAGSDSNNGLSPATPWQTITKFNAQVWQAGDTVAFRGGDTFSGALIVNTTSWGSFTAPLTITSYGTGNATISSGSSNGITATNVGSVVVKNLNLTGGSQTANSATGFSVSASGGTNISHITALNLTVSLYGDTGITVFCTTADTISGVFVQNCSVDHCSGGGAGGTTPYGGGGILIVGDSAGGLTAHTISAEVTGCSVTNIIGGNGSFHASGHGIGLYNCHDSLVDNCYVNNVGTDGVLPVGVILAATTNTVVSRCEVANVATGTGTDGEGIDIDIGCSNCTIEYNYVHDCVAGGLMAYCNGGVAVTNPTIRFNITQNNGISSNITNEITIYGNGITGAAVYGNTCFNNLNREVFSQINQATGRVCNNIFYSTSSSAAIADLGNSGTYLTLNGNDYWSTGSLKIAQGGTTYTTVAAWRTATGQETISSTDTSHNVDPLLVSAGGGSTYGGYSPPNPTAYALQSGSPMKHVGLDLNAQFSINQGPQDYYGNAIPNGGGGTGYNVGAYGGT